MNTSIGGKMWIFGVGALSLSQVGLAQSLNPNIGLVLSGFYKSEDSALSERESGVGLGHTELSIESAIDSHFQGRLTAALETSHGDTELELEEAYVDTLGLAAGTTVRFGRFFSDIGYLNAKHSHSDAFVERPTVYRAFMGDHYFDDGLRIESVLPTPFYWHISAEAFDGGQLTDKSSDDTIGVYALTTRWGGDVGNEHSWQVGFSYLHNRSSGENAFELAHAEEEHEHEEELDDHSGHSHQAQYHAKHNYVVHGVWKWAPQGNAKNQQLTVSGEYFLLDELGEAELSKEQHKGWYSSLVYRFHPQWAAGVRYGDLSVTAIEEEHDGEWLFDDQSLRETDLMLSWSPSHFSTLRLQYTWQDSDDLDDADDALTLQYVMSLGAHNAHSF
tara:strand:+ start:453 stop:1616 length:1164 start_codon:yes stop_codon:yes gene_type:complete